MLSPVLFLFIAAASSRKWAPRGCWSDDPPGRTLSAASYTNASGMSVDACIHFCSTGNHPYEIAGLAHGSECFCDDTIASGAAQVRISDCNMPCSGDIFEYCGGSSRLSVYSKRDPTTSLGRCTDSPSNENEHYCGENLAENAAPKPQVEYDTSCIGNPSGGCRGHVHKSSVHISPRDSTSTANGGNVLAVNAVSPVKTGLPVPWSYAACYVDNAYGHVIANEYSSNNMTVQTCISHCSANNFTLAGVEYHTQCYCGDYLVNGAVTAPDSECNMACAGNATEACGGYNRLSVYTSTGNVSVYPVPTIQKTNLPGPWSYKGCVAEPASGQRVFPYLLEWRTNNTVDACLTQCASFGYPAAGLEYGGQCFCGDPSDVTTNGGLVVSDTQCNMSCSGDPGHLCGSSERLTTYYWTGSPLYVWNTPANTGHYEFLIGGLVVPLIATVGINNKVTFLEKRPSPFANSTGAYELDLSLVDNYRLAWREMHVNSNVFCAGAIVLPDKGARQINVGGYSGASTYGVRLYYPDGKPGVNGTHDWEENPLELSLQNGRWYPTAMMMSNGSILVVGGKTGPDGPGVASLEILPKPKGGETLVPLDYLERTNPNNLYPFVFVLPSGRIFIGYYNEARVLDPVTFNTVIVLPNMPGAVNNFLAGRSYPMEGTGVLLPQHAPYTTPIEILVCGGSTLPGGVALDNCISIAPEVQNPTWTVERMPSKRVMPCMVSLPDGTYMILNGAQQGLAGFNVASDPNFSAHLYDPSRPVGQRFSILGSTIVARMYHSEATLLPDGRVLVSGSDPESPIYPEEFRIEVYVPPYLTQGYKQPNFTIAETDWALGGTYTINVILYQGTTSTMRVSLIAASSSTHGNIMSGGRVLFPAFSCSGTTCTITAPPNAHVCPPGWHQLFILDGPTPSHSAWVRIGGDPAKLGDWPPFPDFTLPGV